jgi:hypothetical protein
VAGTTPACDDGILVGLTAFFFVATFVQLLYLHATIVQIPPIDLHPTPGPVSINATTFDERLEARRLEILGTMEAYLAERRYHQASVQLMSGIWIRYLGFVTGMILALVGASFVLGKLQEPESEITGKSSVIDFSLKSASPGIILVVFGALLMFTTIITRQEYTVEDRPIYLLDSRTQGASTGTTSPTLQPYDAFVTPMPSDAAQPRSETK